MHDFNEVLERLKDIVSNEREGRQVFDKDVALALGISPPTFATMKKRGSIPYKEVMEFCARNKISINWLFFDQPAEMLVEETGKFFRVRYFSTLRASAGGGADVSDEEFEYIDMEQSLLESIIGTPLPPQLDAVHVVGESMEPTLEDGSIAFVDRESTDAGRDGIYLASTNNGLFVKRVRRRADGMVELISDNRLYASEIIHPEEIRIVGKVVGSMERL
jgi:hypothetical protein